MKICLEHWKELRHAISARGLNEFIAKSGTDAVEELKNQLNEATDSKKPYDPLMAANWGITMHTAQIEPSLMFGQHCPLCEVESAAGKGSAQRWINGCTDEILNDFRNNGWVTKPN